MQMHSVARNVGVPTSPAPPMIAVSSGWPSPTCRSMFSITTVALSTRMPTASAKPPSVMVFSVCPAAPMRSTAVITDSGMEARMMRVRRQLPRNMRIMSAVRPAAIRPPSSTLSSAALMNTDWSNSAWMLTPAGSMWRISGSAARMPAMTASVETPPVLRMLMSAPGTPSTATELVCTWKPSCTWATSRMNTVRPLTARIGKALMASIASGLLFIAMR